MKNLFYSEQEETLFLISGYEKTDVQELIEDIQFYSEALAIRAGVPVSEIKTEYIVQSARYKKMRVFYCKTTEHEGATVLTSMTFSQWVFQ